MALLHRYIPVVEKGYANLRNYKSLNSAGRMWAVGSGNQSFGFQVDPNPTDIYFQMGIFERDVAGVDISLRERNALFQLISPCGIEYQRVPCELVWDLERGLPHFFRGEDLHVSVQKLGKTGNQRALMFSSAQPDLSTYREIAPIELTITEQ